MAQPVGSKEKLAAVGRLIHEAQTLDGSGKELDAYRRYLYCVQYAVQTLSADVLYNRGCGSLPSQQAEKLFGLARNCLERAEGLYCTARDEQRGLGDGHVTGNVGGPQRGRVATGTPSAYKPTGLQSPVSAQVGVGQGTGTGTSVRGSVSRAQSWPPKQQPSQQSESLSRLHRISFMDEAQARNHHLMQQYQAHLRQTSTRMLPRQYHDAGLSMLRRLEENVAVAKIRQQTMSRKLRVRELRIQQQGAKAGRSQSIPLSNLSMEDLCEQVTSYENGKHTLIALKLHLRTKPNPPVNVYNLVNEVLSTPDHPLAKLLGEGQYSVYLMLKPLNSAIEKAGSLPTIKIELDKGGTRPEADQQANRLSTPPSTTSEPSTIAQPTNNDSHQDVLCSEDDEVLCHLDLLCSEDDEDLLALSTSPRPSVSSSSGDKHDGRLAMLRSSLLCEISEREKRESSEPTDEQGISHERSPEAVPNTAGGVDHIYALLEPESETSGDLGTGDGNGMAGHDLASVGEPLYDNDEEMATYFRERAAAISHAHMGGFGVSPPQSTRNSGITGERRELERKFPAMPGGVDTPDGAMMSRPRAPEGETKEEVEEVLFRSLPRLTCTLHTGNQKVLTELAVTAGSVLKEAVKLIRFYLETLEQVFVSCYSPLESEENRELCRTVLEASFFPAILPSLVMVYRCRHYTEELATAQNMCRHVNATPKDVSVRKKFWLIEQSHAPYGEAIDKLRSITSLQCPSPKLDCLVQLSKLIIQCIEEFSESQGQPKTADIGVDDILPIMTYVIIRSGLPQLVTESALMEEFIQEGYMKGEEGFCLTSFMTALKFVSQMSS